MDKPKKILTIEAIRGFAAIYVLFGHIVLLYQPYVYFPRFEFVIKTIFGYGNEAVILFFIVSGFSIHYSSSIVDFRIKKNRLSYFYKRVRRIYPIFFLSLILSLMVLWLTKMPSDLCRNVLSFLFLTDISEGNIVDPMPTNFPIWSLTYEVFYYLLYPVLLIYIHKYGLLKVGKVIAMLSLSALIVGFLGYPNYFSNVFQFYWTWFAGVLIAEFKLKGKSISASYLEGFLIVCISFMFTLEKIFVVRDWFWAMFFCIIFFSYFNKNNPLNLIKTLINVLISCCAILICYWLTYVDSVLFHPQLVRYVLFALLITSFILVFKQVAFFQNFLRVFLKPFVKAGSYSYALYIFHWPIIILLKYFFVDNYQLNISLFFLIIILNIFVIFLISRHLEIRLQPKISKHLDYVSAKIVNKS